MISNLVVAESPNEIKIHDAKNFKGRVCDLLYYPFA